MKERNITITLEKAREWYVSNNEELKELALKAFPEKELQYLQFSEIKTFKDAIIVLEMGLNTTLNTLAEIKMCSTASAAMFQLNIIRKALNFGQDLHFTKNPKGSCTYYPCNQFITESSTCYEDDFNTGKVEIIGKIKSEEIEYNVIGGHAVVGMDFGLGNFSPHEGVGSADANFAFLGCASREIADHFSKYFGMLITEAKYGDLNGFEIIEDKYGNT